MVCVCVCVSLSLSLSLCEWRKAAIASPTDVTCGCFQRQVPLGGVQEDAQLSHLQREDGRHVPAGKGDFTPLDSLLHLLLHSFTHSFTHLLIHSFTHSLLHSFTHSLTHSLQSPTPVCRRLLRSRSRWMKRRRNMAAAVAATVIDFNMWCVPLVCLIVPVRACTFLHVCVHVLTCINSQTPPLCRRPISSLACALLM